MTTIKRADLDAGKVDLSDITTGERIEPTRPGVLLRAILSELKITPYRVAKSARVPPNRVTGILDGNRAITADTFVRLGRVFGQSPRFWLNLQSAYDVATIEAASEDYSEIEPLVGP